LINSAGTESKYGLRINIPNSTGVIGSINGESVFAETKIRLEVIDVGATFTMDVEGQVKNSPNWYVISTVTGAVTGTLDISTYDRVRYNITNADGTGTLLASGFILNAAPFKFAVPGGELITTGTSSFSGLKIRMKVSNLTVTDTAAILPLLPLVSRNSIIIENKGANSIFLGEINVTASGVNEGWELTPTSFFSVDVSDAIDIYAIAPIGTTVNVKIMELA
jgi:hypothetical protein